MLRWKYEALFLRVIHVCVSFFINPTTSLAFPALLLNRCQTLGKKSYAAALLAVYSRQLCNPFPSCSFGELSMFPLIT